MDAYRVYEEPITVNSPTKACHTTETIVLWWNEDWQVCVLCLTVCWNHTKHLRLYVSGADVGEVGLTDTSVSAVSGCESSRQRKALLLGFVKQRRMRLRVPHHAYHDSIVDTEELNGAILYYNYDFVFHWWKLPRRHQMRLCKRWGPMHSLTFFTEQCGIIGICTDVSLAGIPVVTNLSWHKGRSSLCILHKKMLSCVLLCKVRAAKG